MFVAIFVQIMVAAFSGFLVSGLSSLVDPTAAGSPVETRAALLSDDASTQELDRLYRAFVGARVRMVPVETEAIGRQALSSGTVDALVKVRLPSNESELANFEIVLPDGELRSTFAFGGLKKALESYERELREERAGRLAREPLYVEGPRESGSYAFIYGLLVPLLVLIPVVLAGALTTDSITEEVQRSTLPILLTTPARLSDVLLAKTLANGALAPLLTVAWLGLLSLNGITVSASAALWIVLAATGAALVLGALACAVAMTTRDRNRAHVIYAVLVGALLATAMLLPVSPVNAVARTAAGTAGLAAYAVLGGTVVLALGGLAALHFASRARKAI